MNRNVLILSIVMNVTLYNLNHLMTICYLLFFSFFSRKLENIQLLRFARDNIRLAGFEIVRDFISDTRKIDAQDVRNVTFGKGKAISPVISGTGPCRIQRKIVFRHLNRQFWIFPTDQELAVLSRFSSVSWLSNSLIKLASLGNQKVLSDKDILRCRLVYPAFVKGLQIHLKFRSTESFTKVKEKDKKRAYRKIFVEMDKRQKTMVLSDMKKMKIHQQNRLNMIRIEREIDTYLSFINLMSHLKNEHLTVGMRLLNRIEERYYGKLEIE